MREIIYHKEGDYYIPDLYLVEDEYEKNYRPLSHAGGRSAVGTDDSRGQGPAAGIRALFFRRSGAQPVPPPADALALLGLHLSVPSSGAELTADLVQRLSQRCVSGCG